MAKTKAELHSDAAKYRAALSSMRKAHRHGDVLKAIQLAVDASQYIDGMMQFEKRFEKREERRSVETIDFVLTHAPLVFDRTTLEQTRALLKAQKRIDNIATDDLAADLEYAFQLMWDAHRMWALIRGNPGFPQDGLRTRLGGDQDRWRGIAESWAQMNLIKRVPDRNSYLLYAATSLTSHVRGKCSACGAAGKATMGTFLTDIKCPKCNAMRTFVILPMSSF